MKEIKTDGGSAAAPLLRQHLRQKQKSLQLLFVFHTDYQPICQVTHLTPLPVPALHGCGRDAGEKPIREQFFIREAGQELS